MSTYSVPTFFDAAYHPAMKARAFIFLTKNSFQVLRGRIKFFSTQEMSACS